MGRPYSVDLRERVVAAIESWMSTGAAAGQFWTGKVTACARARLKWATGRVVPPKQCKPKGSVLDAHADFILRLGCCRFHGHRVKVFWWDRRWTMERRTFSREYKLVAVMTCFVIPIRDSDTPAISCRG